MKARLIRDMEAADRVRYPDGIIPKGTVIDDADCWKLVHFGVAVAEDEECRSKCPFTEEQLAEKQHAYDRVERGIHHDDYDAFDKGLMIGYDERGRWVPGPNADPDDYEETEDPDDAWWNAIMSPTERKAEQ